MAKDVKSRQGESAVMHERQTSQASQASSNDTSDKFSSPSMGPQADDAVKGSGGSGLGGIPELPLGANDHHEPDAVLNGTSSRKGLGDDATLAALAASSSSSLPIHPEGKGHYAEDVMDSDTPSFMLVASLRSQITDLTSQVTSLNSKLVKSYTQIGDLEDEMHEKKQESSRLQSKVTDLEKARDSWEKEIEGGGWVEKSHVQGEMQRLMSKVLEETKSRESAVQAHVKLEDELDNLTSSLFTEANKMVAMERVARARADEKMRSLEDSGTVMSGLLDELQTSLRDKVERLDQREAEVAELRRRVIDLTPKVEGVDSSATESALASEASEQVVFSDGEKVTAAAPKDAGLAIEGVSASSTSLAVETPALQRRISNSLDLSPRLLTSVLPYQEFLAFIVYLRQLRTSVLSRPAETQTHYGYNSPAARQLSNPQNFLTPGNSTSPTSPLPYIVTPPSPAQLLAPHLPLSSHNSQPFLKRCMEEDSDQALRLDVAPGLGFMSRRNVGFAVIDGTLLIEPVTMSPGVTLPSATCALCGCGLDIWWTGGEIQAPSSFKPNVNQTMKKVLASSSWMSSITGSSGGMGSSREKKDSPVTSGRASPANGTSAGAGAGGISAGVVGSGDSPFAFPPPPSASQIHIFKINETSAARYAICPVYCLPRLRAVCEFWNYIRVMERGLLLEEHFKFVQGRGSVSQKADVEKKLPGSDAATVAASEIAESATLNGNDTKTTAVEGEAEKNEEELGPKTIAEGGNEEQAGTKKEAGKEDEDTEKTPSDEKAAASLAVAEPSPSVSQASSPTDSQHHKVPPVPKRSNARSRPVTPVLDEGKFTSSTTGQAVPRESPQASYVASSTSELPPRLPPRHNRVGSSGGSGVVDAVSLIGMSTGWEDRCWAEVVRLKESVFWTRMAAVGAEGKAVKSRAASVQP